MIRMNRVRWTFRIFFTATGIFAFIAIHMALVFKSFAPLIPFGIYIISTFVGMFVGAASYARAEHEASLNN